MKKTINKKYEKRRKKNIRKKLINMLIAFIFVGIGVIMFLKFTEDRTVSVMLPIADPPKQNISKPKPKPTPETRKTTTLYAVGDNLYHQSLINDGKTPEDFAKFYENIADDIKLADIAFVNQETIIGGDELGASGYPNFNTPEAVGETIVNLGFDVVNHASNHILDKGVKGIEGTLKFWEQYPNISVIGLYDSQQSRDKTVIVERNGIKFAFLSYTYGLNGYKLPQSYMTNMLDSNRMVTDVKKAKELSDIVVVSMHWGTEYSFVPTSTQKNISQTLANEGVDLIIGHHPHVIQPVEWIDGKDGHKMLVYYSLGNLVHSMEVTDCMLGAAAKVEFEQTGDDVKIVSATIEPLINHYVDGKKAFKVYKLSEYTDKLANEHGIKNFDTPMQINNMNRISSEVLGDWFSSEVKTPTSPDIIDNDWKTILVNKNYAIDENFKVELRNMNMIPARANMQLDERMADELIAMFEAAKVDGINLYLRSSYRPYSLQKTYYDSQYNSWIKSGYSHDDAVKKTLEYTAYPGQSEHHTGLAADIISVEWENTVQALVEKFDQTEDYKWLEQNAHKFGFVMRFPKGKEDITNVNYEPWHYRYVGKETAEIIKSNNWCLEEYLGK